MVNTSDTPCEKENGSDHSYRYVQAGFQLFLYGNLLYIIFGITFSAAAAILAFAAIDIRDWSDSWIVLVAGAILAICLLSSYLGTFFWLAAPRRVERRLMWVYHAIPLFCVVVGIYCTWLSEYTPAVFQQYPIIPAIGLLLAIVQIWIFLKFNETVADNSRCPNYLKRSRACLFYFPVVVGFLVVGIGFAIMNLLGAFSQLVAICGVGFSLFLIVNMLLMCNDALKELSGNSKIELRKLGEAIAFIGLLTGLVLKVAIDFK